MREIRIPGIRRVLRLSWSPDTIAREVDDEIRFHIESRIEELVRLGASEQDARERARAEFGNDVESRRELIRIDRRRVGASHREEVLMSFVDDVRYAARALRRRPSLLAVTTVTLAIGIAANAVMFGVVDQLLLRAPAHVASPHAVKRIWFRDVHPDGVNTSHVTTYTVLPAFRSGTETFSDLAVYGMRSPWSVGTGTDAREAYVELASGNYFRLLGVRPAIGRAFTSDEDRPPLGERVAVIGFGFWQQHFGGDSAVLGRSLQLQGQAYTVVGVAPRGFSGIDRQRVDVWVPVGAVGNDVFGPGWHSSDNYWWASVIGRLRDPVTHAMAAQQATAAYRALLRQWKSRWRDSSNSEVLLGSVIPGRTPEGMGRESKVSLWLLGVSAIVLLIACANVANLLIARTMERRREIAVRLAMGVSRRRLARLLLTEAALIAGLGVVVALALALAASRFVRDVLLPNVVWSESVIDARVLGFTLAIAVLCTLLAGLAPALQGLGTRVSEGLKDSSHQMSGSRGRLRFGLMLVQTALSVFLLVGAGLFISSLRNVAARDVGVDHDRVLHVKMPLASFGYQPRAIQELYLQAAERIRRITGVERAAIVHMTHPFGGASANGFQVEGVKTPQFEWGGPYNSAVTADFFSALGGRFVAGRDFTADEERIGARVLVVTETLAKGYWPNESAVGKCARFGSDSACSEIVGVIGNALAFRLVNDERAIAYAPTKHPGVMGPPEAIIVRAKANPYALVQPIRREVQALSAAMPFVKIQPYHELLAPELQPWRLGAMMFTLFGVVALIIAAIGLYSVMAYWVAQRQHEIGVRMALGAQRADVVRLVASQGSRAVVAGIVVGGAVALAASRWVSDLLYETSPRDPRIFAAAAAVLGAAALMAAIVPARRSASIDPARAIRAE